VNSAKQTFCVAMVLATDLAILMDPAPKKNCMHRRWMVYGLALLLSKRHRVAPSTVALARATPQVLFCSLSVEPTSITILESIVGICFHRLERMLVLVASATSSRSMMLSNTSSGKLLSQSCCKALSLSSCTLQRNKSELISIQDDMFIYMFTEKYVILLFSTSKKMCYLARTKKKTREDNLPAWIWRTIG
jgi:hypothetical protein